MLPKFDLDPDYDMKFLNRAFPDVEFNLYKALIDGKSFLSVFSCWIESEELLEQFWNRINNLIGIEYQTTLEDDFSSWNIYLALFIPNKVSNALKYNIENDTFFMRKVVFDNKPAPLSKDNIPTYLNNHILGKDIRIEASLNQDTIQDSSFSSITQSLLAMNLPLGRTDNEKKSREAWLDKIILEVGKNEV